MTTAHDYPAPEQVAAPRAREPGTLLISRVGDDRYAVHVAPGTDAADVEAAVTGMGTRPRSVLRQHGAILEFSFAARYLEPLLAAIVAGGLRAEVVVEEGGGA